MRNDDQWFEPGDKVMRVAPSDCPLTQEDTPMGTVFCVQHVAIDHNQEAVMKLVGIKLRKTGWVCTERFRKVEEIQLCVRAAEAMKKPKKQEELV